MWRLQHLLVEEGRFQEAAETGREAHRRLEQYLEDIP
jgi:Arc/MetJ-type ribon-helix-helix transcriptional regulator